MSDTIPVSFRGEPLDLPKCAAADHFNIQPTQELTNNLLWSLADLMRKDADPQVAERGEQLWRQFALPDDPKVFSGLDFSHMASAVEAAKADRSDVKVG